VAKIDWENVTNYIDTVGTTLKTFSFNKPQDYVKVTTKGNANITYTIGTQSGTLTPGQSKEVSEVLSSFTLTAVSGTQTIEVYAKEAGTEKEELATDVTSQIEDLQSSLAQSMTDLTSLKTKNHYIVVEGDSTAAGGTAGASMTTWLSMMLKREITNKAIWGSWTAQVKARLKENVLDLHPKYCILLMGTNDIHGGESRAVSLNNYEYILDTLITNRIEPIVLSVLPRNDFPADNANIRIFNSCLLHMCQEKSIKFVDLYNPLANEDGSAKAYVLHNADNLHWSTYGGVLGAKEVIKAFNVPAPNNADYPYNLFKGEYALPENGIFTADYNADGLGEYWTALNTANTTFSLVDNPSGGKFQVINKTSSTAIISGISQSIGGITENAVYRLQGELEFSLTDRTDGGQYNANVAVMLDFYNASNVSTGSVVVDEVWYSTGMPLTDFYQDFQPPAGTTKMTLTIRGYATSPFTLKVGGLHLNIIR
jgi:lysophospholipase L1-like esterase